jgi:hypothetical protein
VVSAGKLRKLWDSLSELRSSQCERRLERTVEACAIARQTCAVYTVFLSGMTSHSEIAQFNRECIGRFILLGFFVVSGFYATWFRFILTVRDIV